MGISCVEWLVGFLTCCVHVAEVVVGGSGGIYHIFSKIRVEIAHEVGI